MEKELENYDRLKVKQFSKSRYLRFLKDRAKKAVDVIKEVENSFRLHEPRNCSRSLKLEKIRVQR